MARQPFSLYITSLQKQKLELLASIEQVSSSNFLGMKIDSSWHECFGNNCHPSTIQTARTSSRERVTNAGGKRCRVGG